MNEELSDFLRDLIVGSTVEDERVQGVNFTNFNDGATMINICCGSNWHFIFVPSENVQIAQNRLGSIPSTILSSRIVSGDIS